MSRLDPTETILLICDVQDRFRSLIKGFSRLLLSIGFLVDLSGLLGVDIAITEQNPGVFGDTCKEIIEKVPLNTLRVSKMQFSMIVPEIKALLQSKSYRNVILVGIETHICVLQTAIDLIREGYEVFLPLDAVSSSSFHHRAVAIQRLISEGAKVSTAESLMFQILGNAEHLQFKECSGLLKAFIRATLNVHDTPFTSVVMESVSTVSSI